MRVSSLDKYPLKDLDCGPFHFLVNHDDNRCELCKYIQKKPICDILSKKLHVEGNAKGSEVISVGSKATSKKNPFKKIKLNNGSSKSNNGVLSNLGGFSIHDPSLVNELKSSSSLSRSSVLATPQSGEFDTTNRFDSVKVNDLTTHGAKGTTTILQDQNILPSAKDNTPEIEELDRANSKPNSGIEDPIGDLISEGVCTPASSCIVHSKQIPAISNSTVNVNPTNSPKVGIPSVNPDIIADDALLPSPVASPIVNFTTDSEDEIGKLPAYNNPDYQIDNVRTLQNITDELLETLENDMQTKQCYKSLVFKLLSQMNRSDLSDFGTLLKDNLKRDFISTLPIEIALKVLKNVDFKDLQNCAKVTRSWNHLIKNTSYLWKVLLLKENFVTKESFVKYTSTLSLKYPEIGTDYEKGYRLDFLRNYKFLTNWYNPNFSPEVTTLRGHLTSVITCLQFEDDRIITGADDKMIRVYNSKTKQFISELRGHNGGVWALKYDENGILVSGSTDRSVRVWDINKGICTHVFKGHTSTVRCLHILKHKGTKYIVTGSRDNTLHVWKLPSKDESTEAEKYPILYDTPEENPFFVGVLRGHMASVRTVSGQGNIVISGSYDNNLMVWDIIQMKCLYILTGHTDRIYSTIYDHKRKRCISASMDSTIRVWDLVNIQNNGVCTKVMNSMTKCVNIMGSMYTLQGHTALVGLLKLSDKFLVSAAADGSLRGWDSNNYTRKFAYHHNNLSAITTFDMNDNLLVSGSEGQFNIYNLRTGKLIHSNILRDADQIWSVHFKENLLVAAVEKEGESFVELLDFSIPFSTTSTSPTTSASSSYSIAATTSTTTNT